jgi:hypothetical protein
MFENMPKKFVYIKQIIDNMPKFFCENIPNDFWIFTPKISPHFKKGPKYFENFSKNFENILHALHFKSDHIYRKLTDRF